MALRRHSDGFVVGLLVQPGSEGIMIRLISRTLFLMGYIPGPHVTHISIGKSRVYLFSFRFKITVLQPENRNFTKWFSISPSPRTCVDFVAKL